MLNKKVPPIIINPFSYLEERRVKVRRMWEDNRNELIKKYSMVWYSLSEIYGYDSRLEITDISQELLGFHNIVMVTIRFKYFITIPDLSSAKSVGVIQSIVPAEGFEEDHDVIALIEKARAILGKDQSIDYIPFYWNNVKDPQEVAVMLEQIDLELLENQNKFVCIQELKEYQQLNELQNNININAGME